MNTMNSSGDKAKVQEKVVEKKEKVKEKIGAKIEEKEKSLRDERMELV